MYKSILMYILLLLSSCTNVLEIDRKLEQQMVVVNSFFTNDSTWDVSVTKSRNILDDSNESTRPVENAIVEIRDQSNAIVETLLPTYDNLFRYRYRGISKPIEGEKYTIYIQTDADIIQASNSIPEPVEILSVEVDSTSWKSSGADIEINLTFEDPQSRENYYGIKILRSAFNFVNGDTTRYKEDVSFEPIDPALQGDLSNGSFTLFNDNLFDGDRYSFRLKLKPASYMGTTENVSILLLSINEDYYKFFVSKNLQDNKREDPFAQPIQVFTNIEKGLGIFAGFSTSAFNLQ